ncbi:glycosyltransferase [Kribbella sp. NPDC051936]|uniref:glycosyltransferase n=1 Tax=Kribbella sp. NPDC051936 TaxID=3154946 RepID=UPI00341BA74C
MRVVLTAWGSRGDVEPLVALAVALRQFGAEAVVCAPPDEDFAVLLRRAEVPLVPLGPPVRSVVSRAKSAARPDPFQLASELVAARFETLSAVAGGSDALVATGLMPAGARDVADRLGLRYVLACYHLLGLPSRHYSPGARPGTPSPQDETDRRVLWEQDAQRVNALYGPAVNSRRATLGLPPVENIRDYVLTDQPWLAADPTLCPSKGLTELDVVQTGAWFLPDDRALPAELETFLDAGEPPVYVGFGSMSAHAPQDIARTAVEASRRHGRRVLLSRGWSELDLADYGDDCLVIGEVNQQALFPRLAAVVHHGGAGTTTAAARAGVPQVVVPLLGDQPYWASRVVALGIGTSYEGSTQTVDSLSDTLGEVFGPEIRSRATDVAAAIKPDGATVAAQLLIDGSAGS